MTLLPIIEIFEYKFPVISHRTWSVMGRNSFGCGGRVMIGTDITFFVFTILALLISAIIYFIKISSQIGVAVTVIGALLLSSVIAFLSRASLMDPGFIPRDKLSIPTDSESMVRSDGSKFCDTCLIWRPPQAKHCRCWVVFICIFVSYGESVSVYDLHSSGAVLQGSYCVFENANCCLWGEWWLATLNMSP